MNTEVQKAEKLWRHLKIRDEHLLIRISKPDKTERVLITKENENRGLLFAYAEMPPAGFNKWISKYEQPFTLVQQRNVDGCFFVPDIEEWVRDEGIDY